MTLRLALAALALAASAAVASADDAVAVEIRLFRGSSSAMAVAGASRIDATRVDDAAKRAWIRQAVDEGEWKHLVTALANAKGVTEVPVAGEGIAHVSAERPWQLDGVVQIPSTRTEDGKVTVSFVEVPLRVAAWIQSDDVVQVEALVPTGATGSEDKSPASRVELALSDKPVVALLPACPTEGCQATLLAVRRGDSRSQ